MRNYEGASSGSGLPVAELNLILLGPPGER